MSSIWRVHLRRSSALAALPAFLILVGLHVFGRGRMWVHEWLWALYQYHFVTVLLGPPAAGVAAWEGQRAARSSEVAAAAGATVRAMVASWAGVYAWTLVAYAAGLVAVVALVRMAGTPAWPDGVAASTLGPPATLLAAETAVGFAIGRGIRSPLVPPFVAVGTFLVVLFSYTVGPARLLDVGGASASMLGLAPRPSLQVSQILLYLALALAALSSPMWARGRTVARRAGATLAVSVVLAAAAANVVRQGPDHFQRVPTPLRCIGAEPEVCVGPGYARLAADARALLLPYLDELQGAGAPVPERFEQTANRGERAAPLGGLMFQLIRYGPEVAEAGAPAAIVLWYMGPSCDVFREPAATAFDGLTAWLESRVHPERVIGELDPPVLSRGTLDEQRAWVRRAVRVLMACGQ